MSTKEFRRTIWRYYLKHGRDLPWRRTRDPYRIVVSEFMLQQTQVARVLAYYPRFLKSFPGFRQLAHAPLKKILKIWQGLGYNRRALALKKLSELVVKKYGGKVPRNTAFLEHLPGIGKATAGAISAFAFNHPAPFIETNIRRVYIHFFFPRRRSVSDKMILKLVKKTMDEKYPREWFYAVMDYGAMLGAKMENPNRRSTQYHKQTPFKGSKREMRGKLLKLLLMRNAVPARGFPKNVINELEREGFLRRKGNDIIIR